MTRVDIRPADQNDIPAMALLWHEKMTLQQQTDRRFRLAANGRSLWMAAASGWLDDEGYRVYVADRDSEIVGYIVGRIEAAPPGLLPDRLGVIVEIAVGVHSYQSGLGQRLLEPVRDWFRQCGITQMLANVPRRQPVEQAFWRALGATELTEVLWIKL